MKTEQAWTAGLYPVFGAAAADGDDNDYDNKGWIQSSNNIWEVKYRRGKGQTTSSDG
jgi:hypothetical protein